MRHDEDTTRHVCLTKTRRRHDETYVFNEVFGIARYAFVRGFRLVYTWEIYFTLNLKNLQKLFLFFSILFKEESIQKNNFFYFRILEKSQRDRGTQRTSKQFTAMVILHRYDPARLQTQFRSHPYIDTDFRGHKFTKTFFIFFDPFQRRKHSKK